MRKLLVIFSVFGICFSFCCCAYEVDSVEVFAAEFRHNDGTIDYLRLRSKLGAKGKPLNAPKYDILTFGRTNNLWKTIKVYDSWKSSWNYFIFHAERDHKWKYAGLIDLPDEHYEEPSLRFLEWNNRPWLILRHVGGWGTDFMKHEEAWYPLDGKVGRCVLRYLYEGEFSNSDNDDAETKYSLIKQDQHATNATAEITVIHSIMREYSDPKGLLKREQKRVQTRFLWSIKQNKFEPEGVFDKNIVIPTK